MPTKFNVFTNLPDLVNSMEDVVMGPGVSTDNAVARFDGTDGKLLQNSGTTISDSNILTTGELSLTTDLAVEHGGTGRSSAVEYAVICGGTSTTGQLQSVPDVGTVGQVLTSNGASSLPSWQVGGSGSGDVVGPASATDNAIARYDGATGKLIQDSAIIISDTADITGINDLTVGNNIAVTGTVDGRDIATDGTKLDTVETNADVTDATNVAAAGAVMDSDYTAKGDLLIASAVSTPAVLTLGTDTYVLTADSAQATGVKWAAPTTGTVTSVSGTTNRVSSTGGATPAIDIDAAYVGQTSITTLGTVATGTWNGTTVDVANGGTGATTLGDGYVLLGSGTGAITALDVTAKGSLLVGDGTTDPVALTVGTNDFVLTADSAQASGLKWAAAAGGGMPSVTIQWSASALSVNEAVFAPLEQITTTSIIQKVRAFDYATIEYTNGHFEVPPDIDASGTVTFSVYWFARTVPSPSENVIWQIEHAAVATTEDLDSATYTAEVAAASATGTVQNAVVRATWTETVTNLGWVAGDVVYVKWSRKSTDALDTFDSAGTSADDALLVNATIIIPQA